MVFTEKWFYFGLTNYEKLGNPWPRTVWWMSNFPYVLAQTLHNCDNFSNLHFQYRLGRKKKASNILLYVVSLKVIS